MLQIARVTGFEKDLEEKGCFAQGPKVVIVCSPITSIYGGNWMGGWLGEQFTSRTDPY